MEDCLSTANQAVILSSCPVCFVQSLPEDSSFPFRSMNWSNSWMDEKQAIKMPRRVGPLSMNLENFGEGLKNHRLWSLFGRHRRSPFWGTDQNQAPQTHKKDLYIEAFRNPAKGRFFACPEVRKNLYRWTWRQGGVRYVQYGRVVDYRGLLISRRGCLFLRPTFLFRFTLKHAKGSL